MKYMITLVLFALLTLTAQAQYDNADAVYEDITHEYVLNTDGSVVYTYSHKQRLLTSFGFRRAYGESFITYDPRYQSLEILRSVTTMRDGQKVESPFNAFNEVLPRYAAGAAPYLGLREMVVTHTGLEIGALVDFSYRLTTRPGMYPGLQGKVVFGGRSPIAAMTVHVTVPDAVTLNHVMLRGEQQPEMTSASGMKTYTWQQRDMPIVEVESGQPPLDTFLPVLYFTTVSPAEMVRHTLQQAGGGDLGPARAVVDSIARTVSDPVDRVMALQRWMLQRVGRMDGPLDILGFRAMSPAATLRANVGSDLDRAVLLADLCVAAGIEAVPVLFATEVLPPEEEGESQYEVGGSRETAPGSFDIGSPYLYSRPAVICRGVGAYPELVLDPSRPQHGPLPPQFSAHTYLPLTAGADASRQYKPGPMMGPASVSATTVLTLAQDLNVSGRSSISTSGVRGYALDTAAFKGVAARSLSTAGEGMKVVAGTPAIHVSGETVCEVEVSTQTALEAVDGVITFRIPVPPGGMTDMNLPLGAKNRSTPLSLPDAMKETVRMTLHLPKNVRAVGIPAALEVANEIGSVRSVIEADAHDVEVTRSIEITVPVIEPRQYAMLRELLQAWFHPSHTELSLQLRK
ncbi:MAG: DUF3857 domain-containing protein [Bacteroidetes bacterium]|nr:DUF3857 domain-containing protein [Bacteroidota bacterium]